jgi:hypothetical protein
MNGRAEVNSCALHSYAVAENLMDNCSQIEDNCEEDVVINSKADAYDFIEKNNPSRLLPSFTLRIAVFHWNPPK